MMWIILAAAPAMFLSAGAQAAQPDWSITLATVAADGGPANDNSYTPALSDDGRYLAFDSSATNIVAGATGGVYVRDLVDGTTELVSKNNDGVPADRGGSSPSISGDGRFVAFDSPSTNLTGPLPSYDFPQVYLFDRQTQHVEIVSVNSAGVPADGGGLWGVVSQDGRYVAFTSQSSTNLADGGDPNGFEEDLFIHDRQTETTERLNVGTDGTVSDYGGDFAPRSSSDSRLVTFSSYAQNLVPNDVKTAGDVFVRDRQTGVTELDSVNGTGEAADGDSFLPSLTGAGTEVTFGSHARNLYPNAPNGDNLYIHDRTSGQTDLINLDSHGQPIPNVEYGPVINSDARYFAFLVHPNGPPPQTGIDSDAVFIRDRTAGLTVQANISMDGTPGDGGVLPIYRPLAISGDGHTVAFATTDTNLVPGDTNGKWDIYVFHFNSLAAVASSSPSPAVTPAKVPPTGGPPFSPASPIAETIATLGLLLSGGAFIVLRRNRHLPD